MIVFPLLEIASLRCLPASIMFKASALVIRVFEPVNNRDHFISLSSTIPVALIVTGN